jgi:MFS family permease
MRRHDGGQRAGGDVAQSAAWGLDSLNLFTAALQTGFGPFISVWLTQQGWSQTSIGAMLSAGAAAALIGQIPGGAAVDAVHGKRGMAALALVLTAASALLFALSRSLVLVYASQIVHALAACLLGPAIAAITLGLCGHRAYSARLGINARYASIGAAGGAALLGAIASAVPGRAVFLATAALALPALAALLLIRPHHRISPDAADHPAVLHPRQRHAQKRRSWHILSEPALHVFGACAVLFQLGNAAMLPLALNEMSHRGLAPGYLISAAIIVPQFVVAALSPWAGRQAQKRGRRAVLLAGFIAPPLRGLLIAAMFALGPHPVALVALQLLDGVSGTVFGLMVPLIAADVTRRSGFLNLAMGAIGFGSGLGAVISTTLGGILADRFGVVPAFLGLSAGGIAGWVLLFALMPETRPPQHATGRS